MVGKFSEMVTFKIAFQRENAVRPFQAARKLEQRQEWGESQKHSVPPGY